jgi:hypothetical protein
MTIRKAHLQHTVHYGPACKSGRSGGQLRGEHLTWKFDDFAAMPAEHRCERCSSSKLFAFLQRQAAKKVGA